MNILVHTSFIGDTGYNNHARSFFTALNKHHTVKVRNYTVGKTWTSYSQTCHDKEPYMTDEMRSMLILQTLYNADGTVSDHPLYNYNFDFKPEINIVLNDVNHRYFYDNYEGYTIGYNVWETTEYPDDFFNQIKKFNEFWMPSEWQKTNLIKQGYPEHKIFVVPEGVDGDVFKPNDGETFEKFTFLLFGRWEYRKSTKEIIETFINTFENKEDVELVVSADNPFATDGFSSTEERLEHFGLKDDRIKVIHFLKREEYIEHLKKGHVFVSCARGEGWNLPLCESMACGTPSIYSNWGAQLEFAKGYGLPVRTLFEVPASKQEPHFVGSYIEPDYWDLGNKLKEVYENYKIHKLRALRDSKELREEFNWDKIAKKVADRLLTVSDKKENFVFITTGNLSYMSVIEKLVKSINEFSKFKIIVYGVNCEIPFDYPCLIKRHLNPPKRSKYDKWYWKQHACIESLNEDYENYVWIDGDVVVNYNIDNIEKYFKEIENYPLSDIHRQVEFFADYEENGVVKEQSFGEIISKTHNVERFLPYMHVCLYVYNKKCLWWFQQIIKMYETMPIEQYSKYLLWNDETADNFLRWSNKFKKHLPLSNFDTSSYDGDGGQTNNQLRDFYSFWVKSGPYNFNKVFGFQYIPKDKSQILYFHGNKIDIFSDAMIEFIKLKRDNSFYQSEYFFTEENLCINLGSIKGIVGSTWDIGQNLGWSYGIYHEIYNLTDYYLNKEKRINEGDVVVDLGGNIGVFNRWAYSQGAGKVISFEPDKRYFKLLSLNADPKSILFNAAVSDKIGTVELYESDHLGGSNIFVNNTTNVNHYPIRTYTLNYLFETKLIDRIDFLKIDIEGAEQLALNGISDENLSKVKTIVMEYHHEHLGFNEEIRFNLIDRLNKLGFNSYLLFLGYDNKLQLIYFWK